jgi:hypothetical protein
MAGEREQRSFQPDNELQLPKPELGRRAYNFIQEVRMALGESQSFQIGFRKKYNWLNPARDEMWKVDLGDGRYDYSHSRRRRMLLKINDLSNMAFVNIKSIESIAYAFYATSNGRVLN